MKSPRIASRHLYRGIRRQRVLPDNEPIPPKLNCAAWRRRSSARPRSLAARVPRADRSGGGGNARRRRHRGRWLTQRDNVPPLCRLFWRERQQAHEPSGDRARYTRQDTGCRCVSHRTRSRVPPTPARENISVIVSGIRLPPETLLTPRRPFRRSQVRYLCRRSA